MPFVAFTTSLVRKCHGKGQKYRVMGKSLRIVTNHTHQIWPLASTLQVLVPLYYLEQRKKTTMTQQCLDEQEREELSRLFGRTRARRLLMGSPENMANGDATLQVRSERREQTSHERRLALEQAVARLQEQLQKELDLKAALESGLNISAAQSSGAQSLDSKTRAEVEEIAVVEADVARLKQGVAELRLQLNQEHEVSLSESNERQLRLKSLQAQQKILQQALNLTLALCDVEKQIRQQEQELDLTLALCDLEKQKNESIDGMDALEHVVNQQRNALAEAKEALMAERARGLRMQKQKQPSTNSFLD